MVGSALIAFLQGAFRLIGSEADDEPVLTTAGQVWEYTGMSVSAGAAAPFAKVRIAAVVTEILICPGANQRSRYSFARHNRICVSFSYPSDLKLAISSGWPQGALK